jgi:ABC-2 type transport system ATP-binding protein
VAEAAARLAGVAPVIEARDVVHRYGRRRAVDGVSLVLSAGETVALIGPNGAGKTTLLSMLAGTLPLSSGTLSVHGGVGWVPQRAGLYLRLSVWENLRFFARLEGVEDPDGAAQTMMAQMDLEAHAHDPVARLSGGNRQRVNVGIGLLGHPQALLLDEPSAALDPHQRERLWAFVAEVAGAGTAVLFSTHDMHEAGHQPDRVLEMVDGRLT